MLYSPPNIQATAGGNITPFRVVKVGSADNQVLQSAAATSANIGIAQGGTRRAPGTGDDDGFAAKSGENVQIWGPGCVAQGEIASAVTRGDFLTADANGRLVTTTTVGDIVVGVALANGIANDLLMVLVMVFRY